MGAGDNPQNVIFKLSTQVADKEDPKALATNIEKTDEAYQKAGRTMESFEKGVAKAVARHREMKTAQDQSTESARRQSGEVDKQVQKIAGLGNTIATAKGQFQTFVGIDAETRDVLEPLIADTHRLGEEATQTGGDLDFMKKKAEEAGRSVGGIPALPGARPSATGALPTTTGTPTTPDFKAPTEDVKTFAAAILKMAGDGKISLEQLTAASQAELLVLEQLNAEALKAQEALGQKSNPLSKQQTEALDLLVSTKAITAEQRKVLETSTRISNGLKPMDDNTKKVVVGWTSLRRQMQQAKAELDALIEGSDGKITPELIAAGRRAGQLQDRFEDLQQTVNAFNPDKKFQVLGGVIQNVAGGFTALQGVIGLVGAESEGVQKSLLKVQSALAVTQGLQALFGGLRDNLKNLRLLLLSSAVGARTLAVAEGQAAGGAVVQGAATNGLRGALAGARTMAIALWNTLLANPYIAVAALAAAMVVALVAFARTTEEAQETVDEFFDRLETRRKEAEQNRKFASSRQTIQDEIDFLDTQQTAEDKLAMSRKQNAREESDAIDDLNDQRQLTLDLEEERNRVLDERRQKEIAAAQAGAGFSREDDPSGEATRIAKSVAAEERAAELKTTLLDELSEDEKTRIDEFDKKIAESIETEKKLAQDLDLVKKRSQLDEKKGLQDVQKEKDANAKKAQEEADKLTRRGTIADLQRQQSELSALLNKKLLIGSPEFFETAAKYIEVTKALKAAQDLLQEGPGAFPAGSLQDLNQELSFLLDIQSRIPEGAEGFDTVRDAVNELKKAIEALNKATAPKDGKEETQRRLADLAERQRHFNALADVEEKAAVIEAKNRGAKEDELEEITRAAHQRRLEEDLRFEEERLKILQASGSSTEQEVKAQLNRIAELRATLNLPADTTGEDDELEELVAKVIDAADQIAQAGIQAWKAWSDAATSALDIQIDAQRKRVDEALAIADRGNAKILEAEKSKLAQLQAERRKAAQRNIAIAQAEAAANAVVAIARAAAEGGGFLSAVTIAATLVSLAAGIIQARQVASDGVPTFRKGGGVRWSSRGGYTGEGAASEESSAVGPKPYTYHKREYIVPSEVVGIGQNRPILERIHRGRMNMADMIAPKTFVQINGGGNSEKQTDRIVGAIENQPRTKVNFDAEGITLFLRGRLAKGSKVLGHR